MPQTTVTTNNNNYNAANIEVLEGVDAILRNARLYLGATNLHGLVHLNYEAFANSVDEALAGFGKIIRVLLDEQGWVTYDGYK